MPAGSWDESAFWITDYQAFVQSFLTRWNYALAKPLSYPLSAVMFLADRLRLMAVRESIEVRACLAFDERFDRFWEELKKNNPHVLLAVRNSEMLEWHFRYALAENRVWIATISDGSRLAAYAVFCRKDNVKFGLKRIRLVDFQAVDGSTALLAAVLSWALKKCRREGIHVLESIGRWLDEKDFIDGFRPHRRKLSTWTYFYRTNNPELARKLKNRCAWASASSFDGDASL